MSSAAFATAVFFMLCSTGMAASISVSSAGANTYVVQGEEMNGVSGIQLTLGYDSPALAFPTVTQGNLVTGALLTTNTTLPGTIRIAIVKASPLFGSGRIATVSFGTFDGMGGITSITARLVDTNGANLPVQAIITGGSSTAVVAPVSPPSTRAQLNPSPNVQTPTAATASTTAAVLGTVTMPDDSSRAKSDVKTPETPVDLPPMETTIHGDDPVPRQSEGTDEKPALPEKAVEPAQIRHPSVLDRFEKYAGERTPSALMALFDKQIAPELHQQPAIAVSDGSEKIRLSYTLPKGAPSIPIFSLVGAEFVTMKQDCEAGSLIIYVIANKNANHPYITVNDSNTSNTYPITVIPSSNVIAGNEKEFEIFINDNGAKAPKYDLNGDGVHDYVDDYIYTGTYLINKIIK